jgi:uncharacterized protein YegP (UPF0339 family)
MSDVKEPAFEVEYYEADGGWHWKVTSCGNSEVIVDTKGEQDGFASQANAERNFALVQKALLSL